MFPVPNIHEAFDKEVNPVDMAGVDKSAAAFLDELLWCIEAKYRMDER